MDASSLIHLTNKNLIKNYIDFGDGDVCTQLQHSDLMGSHEMSEIWLGRAKSGNYWRSIKLLRGEKDGKWRCEREEPNWIRFNQEFGARRKGGAEKAQRNEIRKIDGNTCKNSIDIGPCYIYFKQPACQSIYSYCEIIISDWIATWSKAKRLQREREIKREDRITCTWRRLWRSLHFLRLHFFKVNNTINLRAFKTGSIIFNDWIIKTRINE